MLVSLGTPRAALTKLMVGKCALHIAKVREATPRAEDSCQSLMRSGTIRISLVIRSMSVVLALFRDRDLAIPRQASKRSSMEFRASSYASVLPREDSLVHSNPRHAVKGHDQIFPQERRNEHSEEAGRNEKSLRKIILSMFSASVS